jgi:cytochrome o ubiquinol oxidase subunit 2
MGELCGGHLTGSDCRIDRVPLLHVFGHGHSQPKASHPEEGCTSIIGFMSLTALGRLQAIRSQVFSQLTKIPPRHHRLLTTSCGILTNNASVVKILGESGERCDPRGSSSASHRTLAKERHLVSKVEEKRRKAMVVTSPNVWVRLTRVVGCVISSLVLASCREGVLDPQGPVGQAERVILGDATAIMLAVIIPVIILTLAFAWWFRAGNRRARYRPDWDYSGRIELITWSIPALVILFLGGMAWISSHELDPPKPLESASSPLEVEVVSLDWRWLFIYPRERIATVNYLVVPTGVPVHFRLTSTSVMNSFFVPQLGSQIYTMPGMTTQLNLQADTPGAYSGISAQFSGPGFSDMQFTLHAESSDEFTTWVAQAHERGGVLDEATVAQLIRPTRAAGELTYGSVPNDPFEAVTAGHRITRWSPKEAL